MASSVPSVRLASRRVVAVPAVALVQAQSIEPTEAAVGVGAAQKLLTLTPWMRDTAAGQAYAVALAAGATGSVDWGCASASNLAATNAGITPLAVGTLLAKYAPSACR